MGINAMSLKIKRILKAKP